MTISINDHTNFAHSTLSVQLLAGGTTLSLQSADVSKFPPSTPFKGVIWDSAYTSPSVSPTKEIVTATYVSGVNFSISRGDEGTSARDWASGSIFAHVVTASEYDEIISNINALPTTYEPIKGVNDNYVTDAQLVVIGNTSGTNSGDQIVPTNESGSANNFLTAYNSGTGAWTKTQPTWANIDKTTSSLADITTRSAGDLNSGTLDGDRLPALSSSKKGGVPATGTPSGKYLKDDGTWDAPSGGSGDVVGPTSAVDSNFASFNTTTGKLIKDSGSKASDFATSGHNHSGVYEPVLTKGNLTEATSSILTISNGTNSVMGAGTSVEVKQANTSQSGYLSSTDWNTFNGKQPAGSYLTAETDPVVKAIVGIVKSNGTTISAASAGTDYVAPNVAITGATKTKITYDAKGLVTSGTDATTADIADSTNKRYVTDSQLTVIGNTSGTNTGDQNLSGLTVKVSPSVTDNFVSFSDIVGGQKDSGYSAASFQPIDATLSSLSSLGTVADKYAYTTGTDTWAEGTISSDARTMLAAANNAAICSTIGLGTEDTVTFTKVICEYDGGSQFLQGTAYADSTAGGAIICRKARGSLASPTQVLSGDTLINIFASGYTSASEFGANSSYTRVSAVEDFTATAQGRAAILSTVTPGTTTRIDNLYLDGHYNVLTGGLTSIGTGATKMIGLGIGVLPTTTVTNSVWLGAMDRVGTTDISDESGLAIVTENLVTHHLGSNSCIGGVQASNKLDVAHGNFRVWDDSTLGSEMITAWTNNATYPYETFTVSGTDITSAINTSGYGVCYQGISLTEGKMYKVVITNFTLNSGTAPSFRISSSSGTGGTLLMSKTATTENNTYYFQSTTTGTYYLSLRTANNVATDFSATGISMKEIQSGNIIATGKFTGGGTSGLKIDQSGNAVVDGTITATNYVGLKSTVCIPVFGVSTAVSTGDAKYTVFIPSAINGWNLTAVSAYVTTASTSGVITLQVRNVTDSVDMLSTAITIDATENRSSTAAVPAVINTAYDDVATDDIIAIDCDTSGTGAAGLLIVDLTFTSV